MSINTFSDKALSYARARPNWEEKDIHILLSHAGFPADDLSGVHVADVGAGTGFFSVPFLERRAKVIAVEPNEKMRSEMTNVIGHYPLLTISAGQADDLQIPAGYGKIDLFATGNAQHWWGRHRHPDGEISERRVLACWQKAAAPDAKVAIAFNKMREDAPEVLRLQEIGMRHCPDKMDSPIAPAKRRAFEVGEFALYFNGIPQQYHRTHEMAFADFENFRTWLISHSYIATDIFDDTGAAAELKDLYKDLPENENGRKLWPYHVNIYTGALNTEFPDPIPA